MNNNFGLNYQQTIDDIKDNQATDYVLGAKKLPTEIIQSDGQWETVQPELQRHGLEPMNCFPYNTKVLMEDFSLKRISEIRKGEYVISHTGTKRKVLETMKRNYDKKIYKIKVKGLYDYIKCTNEHPFLTVEGWKKAEELTKNDKVLIPTTNKLVKDLTIREIEKNKDFLWLLGFYLAEGSLGNEQKPKKGDNNEKLKVRGSGNNGGTITFAISKKETIYAEKIIRISKELFDVNFNIYKKKNNGGMLVQGYNYFLKELLNELGGRGSQTKQINKRLMFIDPKLQLEIVKGWLDGDGCYTEKEKRRIIGVSISEKLIQQIYRILLRNNIKSNLFKRKAYDIHKEAYEIHIYGLFCNNFQDWNLKEINNVSLKFKDNCLIQKISKIEQVKWNKQNKVYNLEIEKDNSYIVNNVAVHNCVSFSLLNCVETLYKKKYEKETNKSDRFLAKVSETTRQGNSFRKVAEAMRKKGAVDEKDWPYPDTTSWAEYYKVIPNSVFRLAEKWLQEYSFGYEWVYSWAGLSIRQKQQKLMEALQYSPLQVPVFAWGRQKGGIYLDEHRQPNHGTTLYGYLANRYWKIFDSYNNVYKKLEWNYDFKFCLRFNLTKINNNIMNLKLYKDWETNTVYAKGDNIGDGLYHPIASEDFILQFSNGWRDVYVENLKRKLNKKEIGATIGTYPTFLRFILNLFK